MSEHSMAHTSRSRHDPAALASHAACERPFMAAANCQGRSSEAGAHVAAALGVPFPIQMEELLAAAIKDGFDPDKLWPWWDRRKVS
jgi:hypothetical protein